MTDTILDVRDLDAGYRDHDVLKKIRLLVHEHQFIGIIGPNGSGKSTLMQILARSLEPKGGSVIFRGTECDELSYRDFGQAVGFVPQENEIPFAYPVYDVVMMGRNPYIARFRQPTQEDHERVKQALKVTGTQHLADRSITSLSGGERQRVLIARILAQDPDLLLLDEPFAHIDLHHQYELIRIIRESTKGKKAVIGVFHDINLAASFCDHLVLLQEGMVRASGTPWEIFKNPLFKEVFRISYIVRDNPFTRTPHLYVGEYVPDMKEKKENIFLICGGGSGIPVISILISAGYPLQCGILAENDSDCLIARNLGVDCLTVPPFTGISFEMEGMLFEKIEKSDRVIVTAMPVGWGNFLNIRVLNKIPPQKIIFIGGDNPIIPDFTGGVATEFINQLLESGAEHVYEILDIVRIIELFNIIGINEDKSP